MARIVLVCVCIVTVLCWVDIGTAARLNRTITSSAIFPDYPPSSLNSEEVDEGDGELQTFQEVELKVKGLVDDVIKTVLPYVIRSSADIRLSGKCMASIFQLVLGMQKLQEWAIRMIDATAKPPSGLFQGTTMALGDFDECINVKVGQKGKPPAPGEREYFHGRYCTVECKLPKGILDAVEEYENLSPEKRYNTSIGASKTFFNTLLKYSQYMKSVAFRFGVCIPSTCGVEDLSSISYTIAKSVGFPLKVLHCKENKELELSLDQIIIIIVLASIIATVLLCTTADIYFNKCGINPLSKLQGTLANFSKSLSAINSTRKLMNVKTDTHPVPTLRGLFLLTVVLNILAHSYLTYNKLFFFKYSSMVNFLDYMQQLLFSVIANGSNLIECYFFTAGFLVTYIRWKKSVGRPKMHLSKLLLKPYIRMTLLQLLAIAIFLLLPIIGYGPFWDDFVGPYLQNCRDRWWLNLFYIQNYWESDDTCLYHTWLLAAIMQLYVVALIVMWFLINKPNIGFVLIILIVISGMAGVGCIIFMNKLPGALALFLLDGVSGFKFWNTLFIKTFDHVGVFSIGMVTGYLVAKHKERLQFGKVTTTIIWCIALAVLLADMVGLCEYRYGDVKMEPSVSILYAMLNRNVFALFLAWLTIACVTGNAGFIPDILSWKALIPAYRLSFLAYLLHLIVIYYHNGIVRESSYFSHTENIMNYFGYLAFTFILSYVCYIFFQVPYMYLESSTVKKNTIIADVTSDFENDFRCCDSNNLTMSAKSLKNHVQTFTINSIKDSHILPVIHTRKESQEKL